MLVDSFVTVKCCSVGSRFVFMLIGLLRSQPSELLYVTLRGLNVSLQTTSLSQKTEVILKALQVRRTVLSFARVD